MLSALFRSFFSCHLSVSPSPNFLFTTGPPLPALVTPFSGLQSPQLVSHLLVYVSLFCLSPLDSQLREGWDFACCVSNGLQARHTASPRQTLAEWTCQESKCRKVAETGTSTAVVRAATVRKARPWKLNNLLNAKKESNTLNFRTENEAKLSFWSVLTYATPT